MISAGRIAFGLSAWKYSDDSLWMKIASGLTSRIADIASTFALTMCLSAVTKAWSLASCSFHQPYAAENVAQTNISFTGVYSCTQGNRSAKAQAYWAKSCGNSAFWKLPIQSGTP